MDAGHKTELFGACHGWTPPAPCSRTKTTTASRYYFFTLWEPATIDGHVWPVGGADVVVPKARLTDVRPPWGGTLARLLYPVVLADARQSGSSAAEVEAWGWLPPTLGTTKGRSCSPSGCTAICSIRSDSAGGRVADAAVQSLAGGSAERWPTISPPSRGSNTLIPPRRWMLRPPWTPSGWTRR